MNEVEIKDGVCVGTVGRGSGEERNDCIPRHAFARLQRGGAVELRLRLDGLRISICFRLFEKISVLTLFFCPVTIKLRKNTTEYECCSVGDTEKNRPWIHAGHPTAGAFKKR